MDDILTRLEAQEKKIDAIYVSVEKIRKYFLMTLIGSVLMFVLPLIGLAFVIPFYLSTFSGLSGL